MIIEGIVTTTDPDGTLHVAAMGPWIDDAERRTGGITRLVLRPFDTSRTAVNLIRSRVGVFHVTDDALLLARVVLGALPGPPESCPASAVAGRRLVDVCQAWEFAVEAVDETEPRIRMEARVVAGHVGRRFLGFNRAAHAVVEAAILVTRLQLHDVADVRRRFAELAVLVDKTGGELEREAFDLLAARVEAG